MEVVIPGHSYILDHLDGDGNELLEFVNRGHDRDAPGTNNQEVLRVLINRVKFLNDELPWEGNEQILHHLRMAFVLHESRHLEQLVKRDELKPELAPIGKDGHFRTPRI